MAKAGTSKRRPADPVITLAGFYRHMDHERCMRWLARELGRLNIRSDELLPYQADLYNDLWNPLDEWTIAQMLRWWEFDLQRLVERGRGWDKQTPAKPQIDINLEVTSKGNFKAEWYPRGWLDRGWRRAGDTEGTDFRFFYPTDHRFVAFDSRPSNELFFIHDVEHALGTLSPSSYDQRSIRLLDHVLLAACARVVENLKARLEPHFDVRMLTDVFVAWDEEESPNSWDVKNTRIARWEIDDPEARKAAAERVELAELEQRLGFTEKAFVDAWEIESAGKKGATGPAPAPHTLRDRVARALKRAGFPATPTKVDRARYLIERHRQESNVVPLKGRG